jgi:hypothetical protein
MSWYATEANAQAADAELLARYAQQGGPLLVLVERVKSREVVERRWVLKRPSTYDWRPPPEV